MNPVKLCNIDEYIRLQSPDVQKILQQIRVTVNKTIPEAVELISYSMPAFKLNGKILCYFAAHKNHIGFYATPSANVAFREELRGFKTSKGAVQFPYNQPIPYALIERMLFYKASELSVKTKSKRRKI